MDENVAEFLRRSILKIPLCEMKTILKAWDFLSEDQLQTINFRQKKEFLAQEVILMCEVTVLKIISQKNKCNRIKLDQHVHMINGFFFS